MTIRKPQSLDGTVAQDGSDGVVDGEMDAEEELECCHVEISDLKFANLDRD